MKGDGQACPTDKTRVQAATTAVLSQNSVKQDTATNEAPDILLIACEHSTPPVLYSQTSLFRIHYNCNITIYIKMLLREYAVTIMLSSIT